MSENLEEVAEVLRKRNFEVFVVKSSDEARAKVMEMIPEGSSVGLGGSMTVQGIGLHDALRAGNYNLFDQYEEGISPEENAKRRKAGLTADYYLTGTNAIAKEGALVNIDGIGNRVAALTYGPEKVIVLVGKNKICEGIHDALKRAQEHAAPLNAKRFGVETPCVKDGKCHDCSAERRICNIYSIIKRQMNRGRFHIIIVDEELGF